MGLNAVVTLIKYLFLLVWFTYFVKVGVASMSKGSSSSHTKASDDIQNTIDELRRTTSRSSESSPTSLGHIDSTLASLGGFGQESSSLSPRYPFSDHRPRPHPADLSNDRLGIKQQHQLAQSLGAFGGRSLHSPHSENGYNPMAWSHLGPNTLGHYNPYKNFAHQRSAKALMSGKDAESNAKRQLYESKMDKQRLEHILFSGDPSGPLDQQKERMRQTLKRRQESQLKKRKGRTKEEDPSSSRGILKGARSA